jgi:hypothetical protein
VIATGVGIIGVTARQGDEATRRATGQVPALPKTVGRVGRHVRNKRTVELHREHPPPVHQPTSPPAQPPTYHCTVVPYARHVPCPVPATPARTMFEPYPPSLICSAGEHAFRCCRPRLTHPRLGRVVSARVKAEPLRAKQSKAKQSKAKPDNKTGKKQNSTPARIMLPLRRLCTDCAACLMPPPYQSHPRSPSHPKLTAHTQLPTLARRRKSHLRPVPHKQSSL